jgi:hypothetical protein
LFQDSPGLKEKKVMKVFVNDVDLPIGKAISRLFACTPVGSRKPKVEISSSESSTAQTIPCYEVFGTLSIPQDSYPEEYHYQSKPLVISNTKSGISSLDTYSGPGNLPKWVVKVDSVLLCFKLPNGIDHL